MIGELFGMTIECIGDVATFLMDKKADERMGLGVEIGSLEVSVVCNGEDIFMGVSCLILHPTLVLQTLLEASDNSLTLPSSEGKNVSVFTGINLYLGIHGIIEGLE